MLGAVSVKLCRQQFTNFVIFLGDLKTKYCLHAKFLSTIGLGFGLLLGGSRTLDPAKRMMASVAPGL